MTRILPGLIMTALWVGILIAGTELHFWLLVICMAILGLYEYFKMTLTSEVGSKLFIPVIITTLPVFSSVMNAPELFIASLFVSFLGTIVYSLKFYDKLGNVLNFLSITNFGALYIGFCLAHLVFIRFLPQGAAWLLVLTAATAGSDTGAYYLGKNFGRRKLCPNISPGKTVEGAIGGITVGTTLATLLGILLLPEFNAFYILVTAITLCIMSIVGDLVESIAKRSSGVKDSGTLLFGHGGVLDRVDSMLISAPLLYYLINIEVLV